MIKRILYTLLILLVVYSGAVVVFKANEPVQAYVQDDAKLDYSSLKDYTLSTGVSSVHYYFFDAGDNDSLYVENTVLPDVQRITRLDLSQILEIVDISPLIDSSKAELLSTDWGISSYPALAVFRVTQDGIDVSGLLEWDPDHPFNTDDVIGWLSDNGLYSGNDQVLISPDPAQ